MSERPPILEFKNVNKFYDGVQVLKDVSVSFCGGEIHALMGANGAGKSTLMKILSGVDHADSGEVYLLGKKVEIKNVQDAEENGITMIHQELNLMNDLSVAQNIYIGREPLKGLFIDDKKMSRDAADLLKFINSDISPDEIVGNLSVGKRQMVEIAKALSKNSKILILDEPTSVLSLSESEELFSMMNELKNKGICLIFISHRMEEVFRLSDRISVLRDGCFIGTNNTSDITESDLIRMMVGRDIETDKIRNPKKCDDVVLEVKNLCNNYLHDVSFELKKGEILGFTGLVGAGRSELARAVYGADPIDSGKVFLHGEEMHFKIPADAVDCDICYLSEDRRRDGLLIGHNIVDNTTLSSLNKFISHHFISNVKSEESSAKVNEIVSTKYSSGLQNVETLSGGNQQKVIIARWLLADSEIFILDEPTRGIDIGAKDEIYSIIEKLSEEGKSIILISSDNAELKRMCNRVLVMCEGRITAELLPSQLDKQLVLHYATLRE